MNHRGRFIPFLALAPLMFATLAGCGDPPSKPRDFDEAKAAVLRDLGSVVIVPAVTDFDMSAVSLLAAVQKLAAERTPQSLESARQSWRAARRPWELSEAFLFGPAKNQQLDPTIDSWPLDEITVNSILASSDPITVKYLGPLEGTVKGFHAIEYLLFGEDGGKQVREVTDREYEYMMAAAEELATAASKLRKAWESTGGDDHAAYQWQLANAGTEGSLYRSQNSGLSEVISQLVSLGNELEGGKMGNPFAAGNVALEEARFSGNSKADFAANLEGIRDIYFCEYRERNGTSSGRGLGDLVRAGNPDLEMRVRELFDESARRIEAITPTFGEAINGNRSSINSAISVLRTLRDVLEIDVRAAILK